MGSVKQTSSVGESEYSQTPQARVQTVDHCTYGGKRQEERRTEDSVPEYFPTLFLPWAEVAKIITWKLEPSVDRIS